MRHVPLLFVILLALLHGDPDALGGQGEEKVFCIFDWGRHIRGECEYTDLQPKEALKKLGDGYELVQRNSVFGLRIPIEREPKAKDEAATVARARLVAVDDTYAYVKLAKKSARKSHLWHHYYDCVTAYRVIRNEETDRLFSADRVYAKFVAEHHGISNGMVRDDVKKKVGAPSHFYSHQAAGSTNQYWESLGLHVEFHGWRVYFVELSTPGWLKLVAGGEDQRNE